MKMRFLLAEASSIPHVVVLAGMSLACLAGPVDLASIYAPEVVAVQPIYAVHDLCRTADGEIRHYGWQMVKGKKRRVYVASRDEGLTIARVWPHMTLTPYAPRAHRVWPHIFRRRLAHRAWRLGLPRIQMVKIFLARVVDRCGDYVV